MKRSLSGALFAGAFSIAAGALNYSPAHALSANQVSRLTQLLVSRGCTLSTEPATIVVSCPTEAIARAASTAIEGSYLRLHYGSGKSYAQVRIGSSGAVNKVYFSPGYWPQSGKYLKFMTQNLGSKSFSIAGVPGGFDLGIAFESKGKEILCELKTPSGYEDNACPDVHWDNGRINLALRINRDFSISTETSATVKGTWGLGGKVGDYAVPDSYMNNLLAGYVNDAIQNQIPNLNSIMKASLAKIIYYRPSPNDISLVGPRCVVSSFQNGKVVGRIALTDQACESALVRANQLQ